MTEINNTADQSITVRLPEHILEFSELYAEWCGLECQDLLVKIIVQRILEIKNQVKQLPYMDIPELL